MRYIERASSSFLKRTGGNRLPVPIEELRDNVIIAPYSAGRDLLTQMEQWEYAQTVKACSTIRNGKLYIFYRDDLSYHERRFAIAHEYGHYVLGHIAVGGILGYSDDENVHNKQEDEANAFALYCLAPPALLRGKRCRTAKDIEDAAEVDANHAREIHYRMFGELHPRKRLPRWALWSAIGATATAATITACLILAPTDDGTTHTDAPPATTRIIAPATTKAPTPVIATPITTAAVDTYYWVGEGEVYHAFADCSYIINSRKIISGTLAEAQQHDPDLCQRCRDRLERGDRP